MVVALKTRRRSTLKVLRYVATGVLVVQRLLRRVMVADLYDISMDAQWMVRVQVANVAHRSRADR